MRILAAFVAVGKSRQGAILRDSLSILIAGIKGWFYGMSLLQCLLNNSLPIGKLYFIVHQMANLSLHLDAAFHALADPTRRAVLARLIEGSATVSELSAPFALGLPTFLKHLKVLEDSGLIKSKKVGRVRTCTLQAKRLQEVEAWLAEHRRLWEKRLDAFADYVESLENKEKSS